MKPGESGALRGAPGANPPVDSTGDFVIGPDCARAPEMDPVEGVPKGRVLRFTMHSGDSRFHPGITKVPPGGPANYTPADLSNVRVYAKPYDRTVTVYVPAQYVPGTPAPVIVTKDGPDNELATALDNLIARRRVPAMVAVMIQNGGGDAQGSERGLEYDTMSGRYAEFVESEVFPLVEAENRLFLFGLRVRFTLGDIRVDPFEYGSPARHQQVHFEGCDSPMVPCA